MANGDRLEKELDGGALRELPPNIPPGFIGEIAPDFTKADDFKPSLNAGVIQESTWETRVLTIVLLYVLVVTSPGAFYLLWRNRAWSVGAKTLWTVLMAAGYIGLGLYLRPLT